MQITGSKTKAAFSLIEVITVIAIIAVLTAVIVPYTMKAVEKARISRVAVDMRTMGKAALQYYIDNGEYPPEDTKYPYGDGFLNNSEDLDSWDGPYLPRWPDQYWARRQNRRSPYRWRNLDADGDGDDDWVLQIDLRGCEGISERNRIFALLDERIDGESDSCAGSFRVTPRGNGRCPASRNWGIYVVVEEY